MARTPEQRQADDELTAAIEKVKAAYYTAESSPTVMTEYVVVAAARGFDEDGDSFTTVATISKNSDVPLHHLIGLCEYAAAGFKAMVNTPDDDDE